jgi:hypothetical protein
LALGAATGAVLVALFFLLAGGSIQTHSSAPQQSATVAALAQTDAATPAQADGATPAQADAATAEPMNPPEPTPIETAKPVKAPARTGAARSAAHRRTVSVPMPVSVDPLEGRR